MNKPADDDFYDWKMLSKIFPIGHQTWMKQVANGRYPHPCLWLKNKQVWKKSTIHRLIEKIVRGDYESDEARWTDKDNDA